MAETGDASQLAQINKKFNQGEAFNSECMLELGIEQSSDRTSATPSGRRVDDNNSFEQYNNNITFFPGHPSINFV
jgi:hypothetical protein